MLQSDGQAMVEIAQHMLGICNMREMGHTARKFTLQLLEDALNMDFSKQINTDGPVGIITSPSITAVHVG